MTKEEMIKEAEAVIGKANVKLVDICGDKKPLSEVILTMSAGETVRIKSGMTEIAAFDGLVSFKSAKKAIWKVVDDARDELCPQIDGAERKAYAKRIDTFADLMKAVGDVIETANERMSEITHGGFPFMYAEVAFSVKTDTAGVYVHSGRTPVCVLARAGSLQGVFEEIRAEVWKAVDATRAAVDRRKSILEEADRLEAEGAQLQKAADALRAAGISTDVLGIGIDHASETAIVDAAQKACRAANRALCMRGRAVFGGYAKAKLVVKGFVGGIVVTAGGKPCLVTRFPKVASNATIEKAVLFVTNNIKAMNESRMAYLDRVQKVIDREIRMREIAQRIDAAEELLSKEA